MTESTARSRGSQQQEEERSQDQQKGGTRSKGNNANAEEQALLDQKDLQLSASTRRAKWIHSPDEHEDHKGQTLATRSHEVIKHWAEERGAKPAIVQDTQRPGRSGVLRFDFEFDGPDPRLKQVSWDEWFRVFDERKLVFLFQEHTRDGKQSNFFTLDSPEREEG